MPFQSTIHWTGPGRSPKVTVLNHDTSTTGGRATAINAFLSSLMSVIGVGMTAQLQPEFKQIAAATGTLTAVGSYGPQTVHNGTVAEEFLPDATQALIRLATPGIVDGTRVRGRIFVPGLTVASAEDGNLLAADQAVIAAAAGGLLIGASPLYVWSRPLKAQDGSILRPGSTHLATGASAWSEFAVLRRRRG